MSHHYRFTGRPNKDGDLVVPNMVEMKAFLKPHQGKRIYVDLYVEPGEPQRAMIGRYNHVYLPQFQQWYFESGNRYNMNRSDLELRSLHPAFSVEVPKSETGGYSLKRIKGLHELGKLELLDFFAMLEQIAIENFDFDEWRR